MGLIILPKRFHPSFKKSKPNPKASVVNADFSGLGKGLDAILLPVGNTFIDVVSGNIGVPVNSPTNSIGGRGRKVDYNGSDEATQFTGSFKSPFADICNGDLTISWVFQTTSSSGFATGFGSSASDTPVVYFQGGATGTAFVRSQNNSGNQFSGGVTINDGLPHIFTIVKYGATVDIYIDGIFAATNDVTPSNWDLVNQFTLGALGRVGSPDNHWTGSIFGVAIWRRKLSASEIFKSNSDFWRTILKPKQLPTYFIPEADAGQTIPVTQVVETNIAQAIVVGIGAVSILVGQVTETDIAQPITPLNALVIEVGQVVETNTAQIVTALAGNLDVPVNQVVENNTANAVTVDTGGALILVTQVVENNTAQPVTVDVGGVSISVNQVSELNTAQPVTALQGIAVTVLQVIETNIAQAITPVTGAVSIEVGQVVETNIAQSITVAGVVPSPDCVEAFQGVITIEGMQSEINLIEAFNGILTTAEGFNSIICEDSA